MLLSKEIQEVIALAHKRGFDQDKLLRLYNNYIEDRDLEEYILCAIQKWLREEKNLIIVVKGKYSEIITTPIKTCTYNEAIISSLNYFLK